MRSTKKPGMDEAIMAGILSLPTLYDFWYSDGRLRNSYVRHDGFTDMYVRKGPVWVDGSRVNGCLTIASVCATHPGEGAFTELVADLQSRGVSIYVECVLNPRFGPKLEKLGFKHVNQHLGPAKNYFLANGKSDE